MHKFLIATVLLASVAGTPALAGDGVPPRVRIQTADLDLATVQGRAMLDRRVARALETVCGSYEGLRPEEEKQVTACRADLSAKLRPVMASLTAPAVAAR